MTFHSCIETLTLLEMGVKKSLRGRPWGPVDMEGMESVTLIDYVKTCGSTESSEVRCHM